MKFKYIFLMMCSSGTMFAANPFEQELSSQLSDGQKVEEAKNIMRVLQREGIQAEVQHFCGINTGVEGRGESKRFHLKAMPAGRSGQKADVVARLRVAAKTKGFSQSNK